jgi:hypothetical protein
MAAMLPRPWHGKRVPLHESKDPPNPGAPCNVIPVPHDRQSEQDRELAAEAGISYAALQRAKAEPNMHMLISWQYSLGILERWFGSPTKNTWG